VRRVGKVDIARSGPTTRPTTPTRAVDGSPVRNYRWLIDMQDEVATLAAFTSSSYARPACGNAPDAAGSVSGIIQGVGQQQRVAVEGEVARCVDQQRTLRAARIGASSRRPTGSPTRASRRARDERGKCRSPDATWADAGGHGDAFTNRQ
jgi:hypothetical protein